MVSSAAGGGEAWSTAGGRFLEESRFRRDIYYFRNDSLPGRATFAGSPTFDGSAAPTMSPLYRCCSFTSLALTALLSRARRFTTVAAYGPWGLPEFLGYLLFYVGRKFCLIVPQMPEAGLDPQCSYG